MAAMIGRSGATFNADFSPDEEGREAEQQPHARDVRRRGDDDARGILIESKVKKAKFLESVIESLGLLNRVVIVNSQFEEADLADCEFVTCRALDKFTEKLPRSIKMVAQAKVFIFWRKESLRSSAKTRGFIRSKAYADV